MAGLFLSPDKAVSLIKRILRGYRSVFSKAAGFIALLALCVLAGFVVAWPAWKLAQASPQAFTAVFLIFAAAAVLFFLYKYIRAAWRADPALFAIKGLSRIILLAGIVLFVAQTYARRVPLAFACLIAGTLAAGFVRFGLAGAKRENDAPRDGR